MALLLFTRLRIKPSFRSFDGFDPHRGNGKAGSKFKQKMKFRLERDLGTRRTCGLQERPEDPGSKF
jgi:hypothetical protein